MIVRARQLKRQADRRWDFHVFHEGLTNDGEVVLGVVNARVDQRVGDLLVLQVGHTDLLACVLVDGTIAQESREATSIDARPTARVHSRLHVGANETFVQIFEFSNVQNSDEVNQSTWHLSVENVECSFDVVSVVGSAVTVLEE